MTTTHSLPAQAPTMLISHKLDEWENSPGPSPSALIDRLKRHADSARFDDIAEALTMVRHLLVDFRMNQAIGALVAFTMGHRNLIIAMRSLDVFSHVMDKLQHGLSFHERINYIWLLSNLAVDFREYATPKLVKLQSVHVLAEVAHGIQPNDSLIWTLKTAIHKDSDVSDIVMVLNTIIEVLKRPTLHPVMVCHCVAVVGDVLLNGGHDKVLSAHPTVLTNLWKVMSHDHGLPPGV